MIAATVLEIHGQLVLSNDLPDEGERECSIIGSDKRKCVWRALEKTPSNRLRVAARRCLLNAGPHRGSMSEGMLPRTSRDPKPTSASWTATPMTIVLSVSLSLSSDHVES